MLLMAARRTVPATWVATRSTAASAASSAFSTASVRATSSSPAGVSRRLRPLRSSSATPVSRSSAASCWETAGGVYPSASAVAAIVPRAASSRSTRRRRTSSIESAAYAHGKKSQLDLSILRLDHVGMRSVHVALAVLVAAVWGLNFVVIEVGLEDFPPLLLSSLRYLLASLPLLLIGGRAGVPWKWVLAVGGAIGVVKFSLLFVGMDVGMPAGLASLVLQVQAFFTVGFAVVLLGERPHAAVAAGLALATAGLALVASGLDGVATPAGFALVIGAGAAWGIGNVAIKAASPPDAL